jgi:hypothetical protein
MIRHVLQANLKTNAVISRVAVLRRQRVLRAQSPSSRFPCLYRALEASGAKHCEQVPTRALLHLMRTKRKSMTLQSRSTYEVNRKAKCSFNNVEEVANGVIDSGSEANDDG